MNIDIERLSFSYKEGKEVLSETSFSLSNADMTVLLGRNGAGKSTLFKIFLKMLSPKEGRIAIDGKELSSFGSRELSRVFSYIPQSSYMEFPYTVMDTLLMAKASTLSLFSAPKKENEDEAVEILKSFGIGQLAFRIMDNLSGGEKQLVLIARALLQNSAFIILDEPTSNLDPHNQYWMMSAVRNMASEKGIAVLAVLHDLNLAMAYADKLLFLKNGRSCCLCTPDKVDSALLKEVYAVNADIAEADGRRFAIIRKEFTL